ncbi:glycosyltransferase [Methanobrevibacter sp.]|uniref:glycosyltransferase family 2 protein n=1 Tax=Methanobrevibacter sp. TaxID=66852 RepID=UPI0025E7F123|nr:glycosyltransferase [Methanobrevibacter sp.]MBR4448449.1 glycosyltransferase [Methanobrevibacter sp.]
MVKISVIVPVYNAEEYLEQCLNHIIGQSFQDLEIICINDGSGDGSLEILNEFSENDNRIKIINQQNHGLGAVRNKGITVAQGDYIYFIDSDDYLELNAFEELYEISRKHSVDFTMFKLNNFNEITKEPIYIDYYTMPYLKERAGDDVFNYHDVEDIALRLCVSAPGCFFKRDFIKDLRFPEGLLFEDNVFFTKALFEARRIYFYDKFLYNRRVREDSLSNTVSINSLDTIEIANIMLDLINEYGYDRHKRQLYYRIFNNIYSLFEKAPHEFKPDLFSEIKKRYLKYSKKWESDEYFKNDMKKRHRHIYNSAIQSDCSEEFELRVRLYDEKRKIKKLKKENKEIKKAIKKLKKENDLIKSSKGFELINK